MANASPKDYKAKSIRVLEGLEAVRKRPAMYIGSTGPQGLHHLVYEVVDNSVDEALADHCDKITVILHDDGSVSVEDNGRGIPTDIHPTEGISAAEVVLTKLHAGGKFEKDAYKYSGGLHGVGISVVNALSSRLKLTIFQDEKIYTQIFERGVPTAPLKEIGPTTKRGTLIRFWPDPQIFTETTDFSFDTLSARLRELAFLNKNVKITIIDEKLHKENKFLYEGGIVSFVEYINKKKTPLFDEVLHYNKDDDKYMVEVAIQYNDGYGENLYSFVNNINTVEGGTHVSGFKSALTKICNKKAQDLKILKPGESFSSDDVREGLVGIINIKVPEPQFEGQTKTKLGNSEVKGLVDSWTFAYLDRFFEENPSIARKMLSKAEHAKRAREAAKKARELTRRKTVLEAVVLPGKLADCTSEEPSKTELFIVEGDSAGGSAKQARDRFTQAILPLKGKILNVEKARLDRILSNEEIKALISAIGTGISDEFDVSKARYHKVILMTDADVDGAHIRILLLTFFFRYMRPIIEKGYLYIAQPPLYKAKLGKQEQYLKDDKALKGFLYGWAIEHTTCSLDASTLTKEQWTDLLQLLVSYSDQLQKTEQNFQVAQQYCHLLTKALLMSPWSKEQDVQTLYEILQAHLPQWQVKLEQEEIESDQVATVRLPQTYFIFTQLNKKWQMPLNFFSSTDLKTLISQLTSLKACMNTPWLLTMTDRERSLEGTGVYELLNGIIEIGKPYMNIQRYKGLGEMNPEQLWETSMDPVHRLLLKVKVEDALEADTWFTTLMGDDVAGRKEYIENYGHFVRNLDV